MNVKLHTPKTLKAGSGMSSVKQFLLSLIATTISIVLTFGTAAIIDHHKKAADKKEMVMMVISDMDKTIQYVNVADSLLHESRDLQHQLAIHPELFDSLRYKLSATLVWMSIEFPETTEKIFSTSIETFNTIGNVNFVNEVSSFYLTRQQYKEMVLNKLREESKEHPIGESLKAMLSVSFPEYVYENWIFLEEMKETRDRCMQMMNVSEKDLIKFTKQQQREKEGPDNHEMVMKMINECDSFNSVIEQAKKKL